MHRLFFHLRVRRTHQFSTGPGNPDRRILHQFRCLSTGTMDFGTPTVSHCSFPMESPCLSCAGQPCLEACPVGAFDENIYRVGDCVDFLASDEHSDCRRRGCSARRACPIGVKFRYPARHARFHMDAFLASQGPEKI
jgi:hypothetical protein